MEYKDPTSLLTANRLDVFLKKLYFDVIGGRRTANANLIVKLYRKHIQMRTGGVEPPDLNSDEHHVLKSSVDDYEREAYRLYQSIKDDGFRSDRAVAVSDELLLLNGSHRLAVAISLGLQTIPTVKKPAGATWGIEWFKKYFSRKEFLFLLYEYSKFRDNCAPVILWGIAEECWEEILKELRSLGFLAEFVHVVDLKDNFDGFYLLVHEMYGVGIRENNNIRRKAIIHGSYSTRIAVLHIELPPSLTMGAVGFYDRLAQSKSYIRECFDLFVLKDLYLTLHAPDGMREKNLLLELFYSMPSLRLYRCFHFTDLWFSTEFHEKLAEFRRFLERENISSDKVCIVGSGVLGAYSIRSPADIDFVINSGSPERVSRFGGHESLNIDVLQDYSLVSEITNVVSDEIVTSPMFHFVLFGIKFADIVFVCLKKKISAKEKDLTDLRLIKDYLRVSRSDKKSEFKRAELLWLEAGIRRGFE